MGGVSCKECGKEYHSSTNPLLRCYGCTFNYCDPCGGFVFKCSSSSCVINLCHRCKDRLPTILSSCSLCSDKKNVCKFNIKTCKIDRESKLCMSCHHEKHSKTCGYCNRNPTSCFIEQRNTICKNCGIPICSDCGFSLSKWDYNTEKLCRKCSIEELLLSYCFLCQKFHFSEEVQAEEETEGKYYDSEQERYVDKSKVHDCSGYNRENMRKECLVCKRIFPKNGENLKSITIGCCYFSYIHTKDKGTSSCDLESHEMEYVICVNCSNKDNDAEHGSSSSSSLIKFAPGCANLRQCEKCHHWSCRNHGFLCYGCSQWRCHKCSEEWTWDNIIMSHSLKYCIDCDDRLEEIFVECTGININTNILSKIIRKF